MKLKSIKDKCLMTCEQTKWINEFKTKIKNELDKVYNEAPYLGFVTVYMTIQGNILNRVDTEEYFNQIKDIEDCLKELGYSVSLEFSYSRMTGWADSCCIRIEWKV